MQKIVLNLAITLDGYMANKKGQVDFLNDFTDPKLMKKINFGAFVADIDTMIVGKSAYEVTNSFGPMEEQLSNKKIIVLTSVYSFHR